MKPLADAALAEALIVLDCGKILLEQPSKAADASIISLALWTTWNTGIHTESYTSPQPQLNLLFGSETPLLSIVQLRRSSVKSAAQLLTFCDAC